MPALVPLDGVEVLPTQVVVAGECDVIAGLDHLGDVQHADFHASHGWNEIRGSSRDIVYFSSIYSNILRDMVHVFNFIPLLCFHEL